MLKAPHILHTLLDAGTRWNVRSVVCKLVLLVFFFFLNELFSNTNSKVLPYVYPSFLCRANPSELIPSLPSVPVLLPGLRGAE